MFMSLVPIYIVRKECQPSGERRARRELGEENGDAILVKKLRPRRASISYALDTPDISDHEDDQDVQAHEEERGHGQDDNSDRGNDDDDSEEESDDKGEEKAREEEEEEEEGEATASSSSSEDGSVGDTDEAEEAHSKRERSTGNLPRKPLDWETIYPAVPASCQRCGAPHPKGISRLSSQFTSSSRLPGPFSPPFQNAHGYVFRQVSRMVSTE